MRYAVLCSAILMALLQPAHVRAQQVPGNALPSPPVARPASEIPLEVTEALLANQNTPPPRDNSSVKVEGAATAGHVTHGLGLDVGARVGLTFYGIYIGAFFDGYPLGTILGRVPFQGGGEVGYGFRIASVTLRPLFGVSDFVLRDDTPCLTPGGVVEFTYKHLMVGVEAHAVYVLNDTALVHPGPILAFGFDGQVGARF